MRGSGARAISRRFLDPVLAEIRDTGGDQRLDLGDAALLGDGDPASHVCIAPGGLGRARDLVADVRRARVAASLMGPRYRKQRWQRTSDHGRANG